MIAREKILQKLKTSKKLNLFSESVENEFRPRRWYRTNLPNLDRVFGQGVPAGTIIEIFGDESSGKTTLSLSLAAQLQRDYDAIVIIYDSEASLDNSMVERTGLDPTVSIIFGSDSEECSCFDSIFNSQYDMIQEICKAGSTKEELPPVVIIFDSIGSTSLAEAEEARKNGLTAEKVGGQAQAVTRGLKNIKNSIREHNIIYIACNQMREKMGVVYGDKEDTPGGRAFKHFASCRIQTNRRSPYKAVKAIVEVGGEPVGIITQAFAKKNKVGHPFRTAALFNSFENGIDPYMTALYYAAFDINILDIKRGRVNCDEGLGAQLYQGTPHIMKLGDVLRKDESKFEILRKAIEEYIFAEIDYENADEDDESE